MMSREPTFQLRELLGRSFRNRPGNIPKDLVSFPYKNVLKVFKSVDLSFSTIRHVYIYIFVCMYEKRMKNSLNT